MRPEKVDIAIVGAGISGLVLALALRRAGLDCHVFEQAPQLGEVGAGISLSPNAVNGLRFVGLGDDIEATADEPRFQRTRHFESGEVLVEVDRANTRAELGAPYLQMHRADLHSLLCMHLERHSPERIHLGCELQDVTRRDEGYALALADGTAVEASLVVGADGLRSKVRETVFAQSHPDFAGYVAWRGLVPVEDLDADALLPGGSVFISTDRIFVTYPIRLGKVQNFVAFQRTEAWAEEGWSRTGDSATLRATFAAFHGEVQHILSAYRAPTVPMWGLFDREPLPRWVDGRVTVTGDAAHPMLPWFGQGAATSIEDAVVLGRALAAFDDRDEALRRYENARRERATVMHIESRRGGERLMQDDPYLLGRQPVKTEDTLGLTLYNPVTCEL